VIFLIARANSGGSSGRRRGDDVFGDDGGGGGWLSWVVSARPCQAGHPHRAMS